jgi:hypothetical protein
MVHIVFPCTCFNWGSVLSENTQLIIPSAYGHVLKQGYSLSTLTFAFMHNLKMSTVMQHSKIFHLHNKVQYFQAQFLPRSSLVCYSNLLRQDKMAVRYSLPQNTTADSKIHY